MIDKAGQNKKWIQMREKAKGDKELKKEERRNRKTWVKIQKERGLRLKVGAREVKNWRLKWYPACFKPSSNKIPSITNLYSWSLQFISFDTQ